MIFVYVIAQFAVVFGINSTSKAETNIGIAESNFLQTMLSLINTIASNSVQLSSQQHRDEGLEEQSYLN